MIRPRIGRNVFEISEDGCRKCFVDTDVGDFHMVSGTLRTIVRALGALAESGPNKRLGLRPEPGLGLGLSETGAGAVASCGRSRCGFYSLATNRRS